MSEFLTKAQENWIIFRLMIGKMVLVIIGTFCAAWQTAMAQTKWSKLDNDERFFTACCILGLITANLIAFFDKTAGQILKGKLPVIDDGNTKEFVKTKTETTTEVVTQPPQQKDK